MNSISDQQKNTNNSTLNVCKRKMKIKKCEKLIIKRNYRKTDLKIPAKEHCHFCDFVCLNLTKLNSHLINEHSELIFCCNVCNRYLPHLDLMPHMTSHIKSSTESKTSELDDEAESNSNNSKTEHKLKMFECKDCNNKFKTKRVLENHRRSIHEHTRRDYICDICNKSFKTDSTLYTHKKCVHQKNQKLYQCEYCDKNFSLKHHWKSHLVKHEYKNVVPNELPFECKICHKKFAGKDNLRKHKKIHNYIMNDFNCHLCGVNVKQKRYLRQHMINVHLHSTKSASK